jgi:hypothetical protein
MPLLGPLAVATQAHPLLFVAMAAAASRAPPRMGPLKREEWEVSGSVRPTCICMRFLPPNYSHHEQKACQEWEDKAVVSSGKKVERKKATLKTQESIGSGKCAGRLCCCSQ